MRILFTTTPGQGHYRAMAPLARAVAGTSFRMTASDEARASRQGSGGLAAGEGDSMTCKSMRAGASITVLALLFALGAGAPAAARMPSDLDYSPTLDRGLLGEGRQAYRERRDPDRAREAYGLFKKNLATHPGDAVASWHFALSCYILGKRVIDDKDQRRRVFKEGRDRAREAAKLHPDCGPCYLLAAINHALLGREIGILRSLVGLPRVMRELRKASELDPAFGGGAAFRIQASIAEAIPAVFGGGREKALEAIENAIVAAPDEPLNYEFLADLLFDEFHDESGALEVARQGLSLEKPPPEYVESLDALRAMQDFVSRHAAKSQPSGS